MKVFSSLLVLLMALSGCAGQRPPEGGPVDTSPPVIDEFYPAADAVNFTESHITLEFNKYVDRRSVEESIFISPFVKDVEFDWSGKEVDLSFVQPLRKNTTYVVTVGTDVVDLNNHNRMAHAFSLAFSTGAQIDRGEIRGRLYDEKPSGVMIFAYRLDGLNPDTLNPMTQKPDYITQCGTAGDYSLSHLAFGQYRVIAVRDEFRNLVYDPEADAMSTAPNDVMLNDADSLRDNLNFQLSTEDTTAPRLVDAVATDERHVDLKISENIDSSSVVANGFSLSDTAHTHRVRIDDVFLHGENPTLVTLVTEPMDKDSEFVVVAASVKDLAHHIINPLAMSKSFDRSSLPDTLPPHLVYTTVSDSSKRFALDQGFQFIFNDVLQRRRAEHALVLRGADSASVPLSFEWNSSASFTVRPLEELRPNFLYKFRVTFDSLQDRGGNHWKDSTRVYSFRTIDPDQLSSIEGRLVDSDTTLTDRYIIVAENSSDRVKKPVQITAHRGKTFLFSQLTEGEYRLKAFQDLYGTGEYNSGRPFPFVPSERFTVLGDSIKVRARWPVEGVLIKMK
ncbi:MAG TPA: Ig-like domain-containing protein [Bacteroidota bacterium]|nr:Ig-like domain-containing protein [Bacteroidota bacterium]